MRPLRAHGQQWFGLHRHVCSGFRLLSTLAMRYMLGLMVLPWLAFPVAAAELFGRWQHTPLRCDVMPLGLPPWRCHGLQIDQRDPSVVRLGLQADLKDAPGLMALTLVGALAASSKPMACSNGRCQLQHPLQLRVISLALSRFDARGLAQGLPRAWPVIGTCRIDPAVLICDVQMQQNGAMLPERWQINAELH